MPIVTTEPSALSVATSVVQNLGPGVLYLRRTSVTPDDGLMLAPGQSIAFYPNPGGTIYGVSTSTCDVRVLTGASTAIGG